MKIKENSGRLISFGILALAMFSSCSRGYGCPYDFSITKSFLNVLANCFQVVSGLF